jgi:hypothetical protein
MAEERPFQDVFDEPLLEFLAKVMDVRKAINGRCPGTDLDGVVVLIGREILLRGQANG